MPLWVSWATFGLAALAAVTGVVNAAINYRRGRVSLRVETRVDQGEDGALRLDVEVVNTGFVPVRIGKMFLTGPRVGHAQAFELWREDSYRLFPIHLVGGQAAAFTVSRDALRKPLMLKCFTVVAETEDGRRAQRVEPRLRLIRDQLQAAAPPPDRIEQ